MKTRHLLVFLLILWAPVAISFGQGEVSNPAKRQAALDLATRLLAPRENPASSLPADLVDPFNPAGFGVAGAAAPKAGEAVRAISSDHDVLEKIATSILPSGMMMFGGQPLLLFREKKLKVGDSLVITFEGTDYLIVITEIKPNSFKIRLNREEITRPIKPGKVP
ncbi:MAG: hypothetical protein PHE83_11245 [Opitutaceae bacterium]|nr:hypothetical protein [Opitutaceae bacterium]